MDYTKRFNAFIAHTVKALKNIKINDELEKACLSIVASNQNGGTLVTVGMGKAYHIAQKTASLFSSLGIRSVCLHPGEASHGDVGVIGRNDVLLAFSTSGKTREVLETISAARKIARGLVIIAVTSHPDGGIRKCSDLVVDMGVVKEAGYLSIAPTTSTLVMLALADFLAVMSAELRGTTMAEYSLRHHSGYLGKLARRKAL